MNYKIKYKIRQPFLLLVTLLCIIFYCIILLIIWPIFLIGTYVWKFNIVLNRLQFFLEHIPEIPTIDNKEKN